MNKKEKRLKNFNKLISKGRTKYSLRSALALLISLSLLQIYKGGLVSLLFTAWLIFIISFLVAYTFGWGLNIRNARKLAAELNKEIAAPPPEVGLKPYWIPFLILLALLLPILFREPIFKKISEIRKEKTIALRKSIKLDLHVKYGEKTIDLAIPSSYFVNWKSKMGIKFLETQTSDPYITATLPDMAPHYEPANVVPRRLQEKYPNYKFLPEKFKGADPRENSDAVIIVISGHQYSSINTAEIKSMLSGMNTDQLNKRSEYDLEILSGNISYLKTTDNSLFAYPESIANQNLYIGCEHDLCALSIGSRGLPNLDVYIHKTQLKNWKHISEKAIELFQTFEKPNG